MRPLFRWASALATIFFIAAGLTPTVRAQDRAVIGLGAGLTNNQTEYNSGNQLAVSGQKIFPQLMPKPITSSCTVNSTCASANDGGYLLLATAASVTYTLPAPGAAGTFFQNFGYDGTHPYTLTTPSGKIYGSCAPIGASIMLTFSATLTTDGTSYVCIASIGVSSVVNLATASTNTTVTQSQWGNGAIFIITAATNTITLPQVTTLFQNGTIYVLAIGNTWTLIPNAADGINSTANGSTAINTSQVFGAGFYTITTPAATSGAGAVAVGATGSAIAGLNPITSQGGSYTFALTDCNTTVHFTAAATATVPNSLPVGCDIAVIQDVSGSQQVTFAAGSGATMHSAGGLIHTNTQYSGVGIHVYSNIGGGAAVYDLVGDRS